MPHCQYVFAQENVPKDTYNDMNRNASSAWINKLFTDSSFLHLTVPYRSTNKYADTNFSSIFWVCKIIPKSGRFWQDQCYSVYDYVHSWDSLQIFTVQFEILAPYFENITIRHVQNDIASTVCMNISLGQLTDIYCIQYLHFKILIVFKECLKIFACTKTKGK